MIVDIVAPHKYYVGFRYADPLLENALEQMERQVMLVLIRCSLVFLYHVVCRLQLKHDTVLPHRFI